MQFYQQRNFAFLISDTFNFFKIYGKNYFKTYFALNGALLLIFTLVAIFGYRELFMQLINSNNNGERYFFENYFNENMPLLIGVSVICFILFLLLSLVIYTFPIFYMKRAAESDKPIKADDILSDMKKNVGKFLIFFLGMVFIIFPLFGIALLMSSFLMVIIIGFFLLLFLFPAFINITYMTLFDYLSTDKGFFSAFSYAMRTQLGDMFDSKKARFWKYWGSTIIMYIMTYIVSMVLTSIPYFFIGVGVFTNPNLGSSPDSADFISGSMGVMFFLIYGISMLVSTILYNLLAVNAGFMYFDSRTDLHRNIKISEIDTIGTHE